MGHTLFRWIPILILASFLFLPGCKTLPKVGSSNPEGPKEKSESKETTENALPTSQDKKVKVFIMMGQSNMVGFGKINGNSTRLSNKNVANVVASVYNGAYNPEVNYDQEKPIATKELTDFGGTKPTPLPQGGTVVVRGKIIMAPSTYLFKMGWGDSTHSILEINGTEVYRKNVGQKIPTRTPYAFEDGKDYSFRLTFLNENGRALGWYEPTYVPGSLTSMVKVKKQHTYLLNEKGDWAEKDGVYFYDARTKRKASLLNPFSNGGMFGPELGFGQIIGDAITSPLLLLKSCIGNRSLGWDLLPPGSEQYEYKGKVYAGYKESPLSWDEGTTPKPIGWYAGKQWDIDIGNAHKALENISNLVPDSEGYEVAGFVWWQGDKDRYNEGHAVRYEKNLVHLIKTLRKEFKAPKAKFVLATLGQTPKDGGENPNEKLILDAKFAVDGNSGKYPEFKGNVSTVYSHPISAGGASNGHYNKHAETYLNVGLALGEAMKTLLKD